MTHQRHPFRLLPRPRATSRPRAIARATPVCDGCRGGIGPWHAAADGAQHCDACHALVIAGLAAAPAVAR